MDDDPLEATNTLLQLHEPCAAPVPAETCTNSPDDPSEKNPVLLKRCSEDRAAEIRDPPAKYSVL